ncbi:Uncharacterised protein [uncultured archaeon]|nr:Uncharacterised protein [uncultured archaeon]
MMRIMNEPKHSFKSVNFGIRPTKRMTFGGDGAKYVGQIEPVWELEEEQSLWSREEYEKKLLDALNWYSLTQEDSTILESAFKAIAFSGHHQLIQEIRHSSVSFSITAAKLIRMMYMGLCLRFREKKFIARKIRYCLNHPAKEKKEVQELSQKKPNIQDFINEKTHKIKAEIDEQFDNFAANGYVCKNQESISSHILKESDFPASRTNELIAYGQKYLNEYRAAYNGKEPYAEGYSYLGRRQLKAVIEYWEQVIADIGVAGKEKKEQRLRQVSPQRAIAHLKFLQEYQELDLKSISPLEILRASYLMTYDIKTRKLSLYMALPNSTFGVYGTKIENIDMAKSGKKILRHPEKQLKELNRYSKTTSIRWFEQLHGVRINVKTGISPSSILLRAGK